MEPGCKMAKRTKLHSVETLLAITEIGTKYAADCDASGSWNMDLESYEERRAEAVREIKAIVAFLEPTPSVLDGTDARKERWAAFASGACL